MRHMAWLLWILGTTKFILGNGRLMGDQWLSSNAKYLTFVPLQPWLWILIHPTVYNLKWHLEGRVLPPTSRVWSQDLVSQRIVCLLSSRFFHSLPYLFPIEENCIPPATTTVETGHGAASSNIPSNANGGTSVISSISANNHFVALPDSGSDKQALLANETGGRPQRKNKGSRMAGLIKSIQESPGDEPEHNKGKRKPTHREDDGSEGEDAARNPMAPPTKKQKQIPTLKASMIVSTLARY